MFPLMDVSRFPYAASHHRGKLAAAYSAVYIACMSEPTMHDVEAKRAMDAMMQMKRIDIAAVERAVKAA